jgi:asparagine synthase (glutamine-hydrolysing)
MCSAMHLRGPDAEGFWADSSRGVALGHRRLSIIDLDPRANQPMTDASGRFTIVFNGEIYNFGELRQSLVEQGELFSTESDTEVILCLYAREREGMLAKLRGMFAFAIWDREKSELFVARDPFGIKPFFLATTPHGVLFASQVKALLGTGMVSYEPDPAGQAGFWLLGSVPEPHTWFRDIRALPAGHFAVVGAKGIGVLKSWWDVADHWRLAEGDGTPDEEVRSIVRAALKRSVAAHLVSDVPVGVFLSGGIDSGSLAAMMQECGATGLQGITLRFSEFAGDDRDETPAASRLAQQYGISHRVRTVTRDEFKSDLPKILHAMDQPTVDGVNAWYASKAVAELGLKVVISGVGGDELFEGYKTFRQLPPLVSLWSAITRVPGSVLLARSIFSWQARRAHNPRWAILPSMLHSIEGAWFLSRGLFSPRELPELMGNELAAEALRSFDAQSMVLRMSGKLPTERHLALGQIESKMYLRNQLLRDSDWASMDHSVELRTPLVDAWLLRDVQPVLSAFRRFPKKRLLAEAPSVPLAEDQIARAKMGFAIPVHQWLVALGRTDARSGTSRGWARDLTQHIYGHC